ncbi:hypothetical protein BaRGS_00026855 [Batillaria attramentaria]|uniref:Uncharacterized protein n=1 Tax=Batillaria attramentaria TaxID=370345 RepID=A0ABD0K4G8_9CAEN
MATTEFDVATILEEPDEFDDTEASTSSQHQSQLKHISRELLAEVFQSLTENQCLTEESQKAIQDIAGKLDSHEKLTFLQTCLVPRGRFPSAAAERATANFHKTLLVKIPYLVEEFGMVSGDIFLLCLTIFEHLKTINYGQTAAATDSKPDSVTSEERDILQYIGGSIVCSIKNKLTASSHDQEGKLLLIASLCGEKPSQEGSSASLTSLLDRGGLTYVKPGVIQCMEMMEMEFRRHGNNVSAREKFMGACMNNQDLTSTFYSCTYKCLATEEEREDIFENMLRLFFKIRIHHQCKVFMDKYRAKNQLSSKQKGIRKQLKMSKSS